MRKKTKITIDPKYVLAAVLIFCVVLGVISYRFEDKMTPIRSAAGNAIIPMQKGINSIGRALSDKLDYLTTMKKTVDENKRLKKEIAELSAENKLLQQDKYELDNFRKLYDLDEQYAGYPKVAARVINGDPTNWNNIFIIDKGTEDGLKKNMNVMAGDGLVGIITEVNKSYAKVRSIIDDDSNVYGTVLKNSENCIVSGNLTKMKDGVIDVTGIDGNVKIEDGAEIVTSQISDKYLPGILIGYLRDLKKDSSNITQRGNLTPVVDFSNLDMVFVITEVKDSAELEEMLQ
ncbi:MAG TPA: rod shape-determining protein MreC [Lachnospiraceae bacterium]|nr:rod shape-determining protein MreC [Lachnospiraceae bacterium]